MRFQDHLKLFLADTLIQIVGYWSEEFIYRLLQLDTRQRHILRERRKMTKDLWFRVLRRYGWTCAKCDAYNFENLHAFKPKMEVDHVVSLFNWGRTEWGNLQVLCKRCNRAKGTRTADYRKTRLWGMSSHILT